MPAPVGGHQANTLFIVMKRDAYTKGFNAFKKCKIAPRQSRDEAYSYKHFDGHCPKF